MEIQECAQSEQYKSYWVRKRICVSSDWQILERPSSAKPAEAWEKSQFLAKCSKHTAFVLTFDWEQISFRSHGNGFIKRCSLRWSVHSETIKMNSTKRLSQRVPLWLGVIGGGVVLNWEVSDFHNVIIPGKWLPCSQASRWIHVFTANYYLTKCINQQQRSGQPNPDPSSQKVIMLKLPQGRHCTHWMLKLFFFFFAGRTMLA